MKPENYRFCCECEYCRDKYFNPMLAECFAPQNYKERATPISLYLVGKGKLNTEDIPMGEKYYKYCWQHRALGISDTLFGATTCTKRGLWYKERVEETDQNETDQNETEDGPLTNYMEGMNYIQRIRKRFDPK